MSKPQANIRHGMVVYVRRKNRRIGRRPALRQSRRACVDKPLEANIYF